MKIVSMEQETESDNSEMTMFDCIRSSSKDTT